MNKTYTTPDLSEREMGSHKFASNNFHLNHGEGKRPPGKKVLLQRGQIKKDDEVEVRDDETTFKSS